MVDKVEAIPNQLKFLEDKTIPNVTQIIESAVELMNLGGGNLEIL